jgi:hypothetical protein
LVEKGRGCGGVRGEDWDFRHCYRAGSCLFFVSDQMSKGVGREMGSWR